MKKRLSRINIFFAELKRRKVINLATMYSVVGLGIIESIDVIGGRFLFPDWLIRVVIMIVIIGFPVTLIISWIFDISSKGIERTKALTPEQQAELPPLRLKPAWTNIIGLIIIFILSVAFFTVPRPNYLGFKSRDWVLIADLENNTSEEIFNQSLLHALTVAIDQSKYINIYPRKRIQEVLHRMQIDTIDRIDIPISLEIAERENIKAVLALTISEVGGSYILSTKLLNPYTGVTVRTRQEKADSREHILNALDKLAASARKDLGESLKRIMLRTVPLPAATTSSLEALKLYSDGAVAWSNSKWNEAYSLWSRAVELDSGFAWANACLGFASEWLGRSEEADEHYKRSLSQLNRVTEKERLWLTAIISSGAESVEAYKTYLQQYPDDRDGWYNMGNGLRVINRIDDAIEAYNRSIEIDPSNSWPYVNLAVIYDSRGQYELANKNFEASFRLDPTGVTNWRGDVNRISGFVLVKIGDIKSARQRFELLLRGEDNARANGLRSLALLEMYQGNHSSAVNLLQEAVILNQRTGSTLSEFRNRMYIARAYQSLNLNNELSQEIEKGKELAGDKNWEPYWVLHLALRQIAAGDLDGARGWLNLWTGEQVVPNEAQWVVEYLRGEIFLTGGNIQEAIESLTISLKLTETGQPMVLEALGRAYREAGNQEESVNSFKGMIDLLPLGSEYQEPWVLAHYQLGKLYDEAGNKDEAGYYLKKFLDLWGSGDKGLSGVEDARKILASYGGGE